MTAANGTLGTYPDGTIDVTCWCEASVVNVPLGDVRDGRTGSCSPACQPGCTPGVGGRGRGRVRKVEVA